MFSIYGVAGRVFNGPLDRLRSVRPVAGKPRVEPLQDDGAELAWSAAWAGALGAGLTAQPEDGDRPGDRQAGARPAAAPAAGLIGAYREAARPPRAPLRTVGELMTGPALTLPQALPAREAWQALAARRVSQAPVLGAEGVLVGLVGRVDLAPGPEVGDPAGHWQQPVARLMRTPVPAVQADASLREVAQALLVTGLPGLPVVDEAGTVLGFLSRTDLLRGVAQNPPLDLWA